MTTLGNFLMLADRIKTPEELREERQASHESEVTTLLKHIRSEFRGVPCTIPLSWHEGMGGSYIIARPTEEVWKLVQYKLEKELIAAGWAPFYTTLRTYGIWWWKTTYISITNPRDSY